MWRSEARIEKMSTTRGLHPSVEEGTRRHGLSSGQPSCRPGSENSGTASTADGQKGNFEQFDDADPSFGSSATSSWNWTEVGEATGGAEACKSKYTPEVGMEIRAQIHGVMGSEYYSNDRIEEYWRHQQGKGPEAPPKHSPEVSFGGAGDCRDGQCPGNSNDTNSEENARAKIFSDAEEDVTANRTTVDNVTSPPDKTVLNGAVGTADTVKTDAVDDGNANTTECSLKSQCREKVQKNGDAKMNIVANGSVVPETEGSDKRESVVAADSTEMKGTNGTKIEEAGNIEGTSTGIKTNLACTISQNGVAASTNTVKGGSGDNSRANMSKETPPVSNKGADVTGNSDTNPSNQNVGENTKDVKSCGDVAEKVDPDAAAGMVIPTIQIESNINACASVSDSLRGDIESDAEIETCQSREDLEDGDGDSSSYVSAEAGGDIDMESSQQIDSASGNFSEMDALSYGSGDADDGEGETHHTGNAGSLRTSPVTVCASSRPSSSSSSVINPNAPPFVRAEVTKGLCTEAMSNLSLRTDGGSGETNSAVTTAAEQGASGSSLNASTLNGGALPAEAAGASTTPPHVQFAPHANHNGDTTDYGDGGYGSGGDGDGDGVHGGPSGDGGNYVDEGDGGGRAPGDGEQAGGGQAGQGERPAPDAKAHADGGQGDANGQAGDAAAGASGGLAGYGDGAGEGGSKDLGHDAAIKACADSCRPGKGKSRPLSALAEPWYPRNYTPVYAHSTFPLDKI